MSMFCVREACLAMMTFVALFSPWLSESCTIHDMWTKHRAERKQHPCTSNSGRWFCQFLAICRWLDKGCATPEASI